MLEGTLLAQLVLVLSLCSVNVSVFVWPVLSDSGMCVLCAVVGCASHVELLRLLFGGLLLASHCVSQRSPRHSPSMFRLIPGPHMFLLCGVVLGNWLSLEMFSST